MRDEITQQTMQAIGAKAAPIVTYTGGATAVFFGLSANEFAALCGVLIGIAGLVLQYWFKRRELQLREEYYNRHREEP